MVPDARIPGANLHFPSAGTAVKDFRTNPSAPTAGGESPRSRRLLLRLLIRPGSGDANQLEETQVRRLPSPRGGVEEVLERRLRAQVSRTVVEMFQVAGAFPSPSNGNKMSRGLIAGWSGVGRGGGEGGGQRLSWKSEGENRNGSGPGS